MLQTLSHFHCTTNITTMTSHNSEDSFAYALSSNAAWAAYKAHQNPNFFSKLAAGQSPSILWLGCADSRVPETTILGLQPGDVFVHRNIANIITPTDLSFNAVLEYAVNNLGVQHIVLCGHTSCGGVAGALGTARIGGVIDTWISPLKALKRANAKELEALDETARSTKLAELNVAHGVEVILSNHVVEEAVLSRGLKVHGAIYDIAQGKVLDLKCGNEEKVESAAAGAGEIVHGHYAQLEFGEGSASMAVR